MTRIQGRLLIDSRPWMLILLENEYRKPALKKGLRAGFTNSDTRLFFGKLNHEKNERRTSNIES